MLLCHATGLPSVRQREATTKDVFKDFVEKVAFSRRPKPEIKGVKSERVLLPQEPLAQKCPMIGGLNGGHFERILLSPKRKHGAIEGCSRHSDR
ncbi:MAG: hypothetical protein USCAAHI_01159 [Beijerinckiaceae bacterium]|nr:MAG: hypothetical protein USCAAHI_01159 [Beijerinckiaceae bacterium]